MSSVHFQLEEKFDVEEVLGSGGFGRVFKCWHRDLEEYQAVKVLKTEFLDRPGILERFREEARIARGLDHEHVVSVIDLAVDDHGKNYISMKYIGGPRLGDVLKGGRLDLKIAFDICRQLLEGLVYLHTKSVWHGDFSTDNVLIARKEGRPLAKIIDLGAAVNTQRPTELEDIGKLQNLSPERLNGDTGASPEDDVFAAGIVFYQILTGDRPFVPRSQRSEHQPPRSLLSLPDKLAEYAGAYDIPKRIQTLVLEMLSLDAAQRPSASAVLEAWQEFVDTAPVEDLCEASAVLRRASYDPAYKRAYLEALRESVPIDREFEQFADQMANFIPEQQIPRFLSQAGLMAPLLFLALGSVVIMLSIGDIVSLLS